MIEYMDRIDIRRLFPVAKPIVGMVHAIPLPGAPHWAGSMGAVIDRACSDATALAAGGVDGIFIENYGDVPFYPGVVPPETVAALSIVVREVMRVASLPI